MQIGNITSSESEIFMKKFLMKICIGSIALVVFVIIGFPTFNTNLNKNVNKNTQVKEKKGFISRNNSGHYTRNTGKSYKKNEKTNYSNIIYIGEPTEGLLD